jgi:uncharacterized protein (DUF3084 family)
MGGLGWGIGLLVVEATLFVACAGWLLFRIERRSEDAAYDAQRAFEDMRSLVREMRGAEELLRDQAERANIVLSGLAASGRAFAEGQQAAAAVAPGDAEVHADNRRLAAQKGRLEGELEVLRPRLHDLESQLGELRRDRRGASAAATAAEALRTTNEQLMAELREARQANRDLRTRLEPLTTEMKAVQAQLIVLAEGTGDEEASAALQAAAERAGDMHRAQAATLQQELERHKQRLEQLQDELSRTLREKSFIEDRFLDNIAPA